MCPWRPTPVGVPRRRTKASRAAIPLAEGQGCPGEQLLSSSLAAMPESLIRGPSWHQTGPSPSQTCVGVHVNVWPAGITGTVALTGNASEQAVTADITACKVFRRIKGIGVIKPASRAVDGIFKVFRDGKFHHLISRFVNDGSRSRAAHLTGGAITHGKLADIGQHNGIACCNSFADSVADRIKGCGSRFLVGTERLGDGSYEIGFGDWFAH